MQGFGREVQTAQIVISQNDYKISQEQFRQQVWTTVRTVYRAYWALVIAENNLETRAPGARPGPATAEPQPHPGGDRDPGADRDDPG